MYLKLFECILNFLNVFKTLRMYLKKNVAKLELGLATGKRQYDKRRAIRDREMDREAKRSMKAFDQS